MGDQRRGSAEVAGYPRVAETIDRIVRDRGDCQDCPAEQAEAGCSGNWEDAALKHADGEKDEDVVPWKALLINNWKEKNNDAERRASEANSSLTEREALDFREGYLTSITHVDDFDLQDPRPMGMPDFVEGGDNNARLDWRR